ncbi:MAG TPA: RsmD family RNA methyltransferase, partial [Spirochaetia bacterium]|nr:RsmD family RNA methyltransferase [Spirochaetia bacterium]
AQKTGLYLDQLQSYRCVAGMDFSGLRGLDLFCYSGIFGMLSIQRGAQRVVFVDSSVPALSQLESNLQRNKIPTDRYDIVRSDVLSFLESCAPEEHDFAFLDPPKFIKSRKSYYQGLQGYYNLNRAGIRVLRDRGLLFTFSCSHHAGEEIFRKKIIDAMQKEGCTARELYRFRQNADHAVLLPMEESFYLKGFLFAIERQKEETDDAMGIS